MYVCMYVYIYISLYHIKTSVCPAPGSFPWPIIQRRSKVSKSDHQNATNADASIVMLFFLRFLPFPSNLFLPSSGVRRPSLADGPGCFCHKFAQNAKNSLVTKEVLGYFHHCNFLQLHIIRIHSRLLVMFQSCQRFHNHLFRKKVGRQKLSKQSLQIYIP